nr:MAG: putative minor capsid protein [Lake Baikal virophage 8]
MSQFDVVKREVTADQIYFDVTVSNFQSTTTEPPVFYYNEQRTMPFINCPEDYYLSIIRFTMETGTIPVFIPSIKPNQANRDETIYNITLEITIGGTLYSASEPLIWIPQDESAPLPIPPDQTQNKLQINDTGYYNCYQYTWLTLLISNTFRTCFNKLSSLVPTSLPTTYPPVCYWDSTSNGIVMYADVGAYDFNPLNPANEIAVYWNAPLYELFASLPATFLGYKNQQNFRIGLVNVGNTNLTTIVPQPITFDPSGNPIQYTAITLYQECPTTANISPVTAVVFTSNTLPIQPSQVSTPLILNNAGQVALGGNNADIANIITDLVSDSGAYRPNLVYVPQAEYRLITLYGNRPLYNLDLQIFYRLKTGQLIPFRIASGQAVTVKLAFIKKPTKVV